MNRNRSGIKLRIYLCTFLSTVCGGGLLPEIEELQTEHLEHRQNLEEHLTQQLSQLRIRHLRTLLDIGKRAKRNHLRSQELWASQQHRFVTKHEDIWWTLLPGPEDLPPALQSVNDQTLKAFKHIAQSSLEDVKEAHAGYHAHLLELQRNLTRADEIDRAILVRDLIQSLPEEPEFPKILAELKALAPSEEKESQPFVPPGFDDERGPMDASYFFTRDNPAFQSFLEIAQGVSAGHRDGPEARILLGRSGEFNADRGLGMVAVFDRDLLKAETYDTYAHPGESQRFVEDVRKLPYGTFVILAVRDDGTRRFSGSAQSALFRLGAEKGILGLPYRSSYLLIGAKGLAPGHGIELTGPGRIEFPNPEPAE